MTREQHRTIEDWLKKHRKRFWDWSNDRYTRNPETGRLHTNWTIAALATEELGFPISYANIRSAARLKCVYGIRPRKTKPLSVAMATPVAAVVQELQAGTFEADLAALLAKHKLRLAPLEG